MIFVSAVIFSVWPPLGAFSHPLQHLLLALGAFFMMRSVVAYENSRTKAREGTIGHDIEGDSESDCSDILKQQFGDQENAICNAMLPSSSMK